MIEIEGVSFWRGQTPILTDVSLTIPSGKITALVGPNGAGKSTLLALMSRLLPLRTGRITIDGKPVATTPGPEMARTVAILRQDPNVSTRLRVRELVAFGRFPHSRGRLTGQDHALVDEALARFDLLQMQDRFLDTLSGGQRQRALIAMAYCQGAGTLLLDEPLNNLDMRYARDLMTSLRQIAEDQKRTIVVVLHDINHAAAHADDIVAMRDGRVAFHDRMENVLTPDRLEAVFGYRMDVATINGAPFVLHYQ